MSFQEEIQKLRKKVADAVAIGVVNDEGKEIYEATLIQILNEAEMHRQRNVSQIENLKKQISTLEGQINGFTMVSSIIQSILNGYITIANRAKREEEERAAEKEAILKAEENNIEEEIVIEEKPKKKTKK
jgi:hypothetical protein